MVKSKSRGCSRRGADRGDFWEQAGTWVPWHVPVVAQKPMHLYHAGDVSYSDSVSAQLRQARMAELPSPKDHCTQPWPFLMSLQTFDHSTRFRLLRSSIRSPLSITLLFIVCDSAFYCLHRNHDNIRVRKSGDYKRRNPVLLRSRSELPNQSPGLIPRQGPRLNRVLLLTERYITARTHRWPI